MLSPLHVTEPGAFLGKHSERLVIRKGKETISEHPLMNLEQVLVESRAGGISWDLVHECCQRGIPITLLGRGGQPVARVTSPALTATVQTRREQLAAFLDERGARVACGMARAKVHNQASTLRYFGKYRKATDPEVFAIVETEVGVIRELERELSALCGGTIDDIRSSILNLEGRAGACYWRAVSALLGDKAPLGRREHRGTSDPTNAMFNYGYGILQSQVWTAITLAGLEPFAGFLHVDRPGRPSLVLDFMEEFRQPVVDRALIAAVGKGLRIRLEEDETSGSDEKAPTDAKENAPDLSPRAGELQEENESSAAGIAGADSVSGDIVQGERPETTLSPDLPAKSGARFLCRESKKEVAEKVLTRLETREPYEGARHSLRNIIQMQARRLATALRSEHEYEGFTIAW